MAIIINECLTTSFKNKLHVSNLSLTYNQCEAVAIFSVIYNIVCHKEIHIMHDLFRDLKAEQGNVETKAHVEVCTLQSMPAVLVIFLTSLTAKQKHPDSIF